MRPDVVKYIRNLWYKIEFYQLEPSGIDNDDELLSPILPLKHFFSLLYSLYLLIHIFIFSFLLYYYRLHVIVLPEYQ